MEYRPFYLAREWTMLGHHVTVVAASFSHLRIKQPEIRDKVSEEYIEGMRYVWLKTPSYEGNGIARVWNMITFQRRLRKWGKEMSGTWSPDVVVASSPHPLVIYPARDIALKNRSKLIFEVRDLWPLTLIELSGISRRHPFVLFLTRAERFAYKHADHIVSVLPKLDDYLREHGVNPIRFACIPNGIDIESCLATSPLPKEHAAAIKELKSKGSFLVGYVGQHGLANALDYCVEAGPLLADRNISLVFVGQGPEKSRLQEKAKMLNVENIVFLPPVPRQAVSAVLEKMDVLLLSWKRSPLYRYGISPNKIMDYMMAARPIVHAVESGNDPVAEAECGISCQPENPQAIAKAVIELMERTTNELLTMGLNGKEYVQHNHDYRVLAKKYLDIIDHDTAADQ